MAVDPWDERLRERLGGYAEEGLPSAWDDMARRLDEAAGPADPADQPLKDALADFRAEGPVTGWERIATTLDQADHAWEETLRRKVAAFEAPADPHGWSQFVGYWRDSRFVRTKLILLKGIEAMALLLVVLTFTRQGAFNIPSSPSPEAPAIAEVQDPAASSEPKTLPSDAHRITPDGSNTPQGTAKQDVASAGPAPDKYKHRLRTATTETENSHSTEDRTYPNPSQTVLADKPGRTSPASTDIMAEAADQGPLSFGSPVSLSSCPPVPASASPVPLANASDPGTPPIPLEDRRTSLPRDPHDALTPIDPLEILLDGDAPDVPMPKPGRPTGRSAAELSVFALADMSALRMSEERIYSLGQQVVFPEKRLYSQGFGGGVTIATGHPRYALETGILYSSRTFSPGRMVTLGDALDNSTVDFQALRLQLISVPVQGRYRLDRKGRIQTYAAGGMTFTVVAQSDLDVVSSYNFTSLAAGADPNSDPVIARTLRETRRISETLRDGAPFSSKSYVSVNAGLGMEYVIMNHKKIFLQAQAQYQIPNLEFSNHNGKDLRALVVQAGLRSSLGY